MEEVSGYDRAAGGVLVTDTVAAARIYTCDKVA